MTDEFASDYPDALVVVERLFAFCGILCELEVDRPCVFRRGKLVDVYRIAEVVVVVFFVVIVVVTVIVSLPKAEDIAPSWSSGEKSHS